MRCHLYLKHDTHTHEIVEKNAITIRWNFALTSNEFVEPPQIDF